MKMFWQELGGRYCLENGFKKIAKADDIEEEGSAMHVPTLCVINHDCSGSMSPSSKSPTSDYNQAVAGAKKAVE